MMPVLTVWAMRAALAWLVVGFTIGAVMLADKGLGRIGLGAGWLHVHVHALLFGFLVQTIFAVAYWMLPRFGRDRPRTPAAAAAVAMVNLAPLLAGGLLADAPVHAAVALTEATAVAVFVWHAWPRIKPFRSS